MAEETTETSTNGTTQPVHVTVDSPTVPAFRLEQELSAKREAVRMQETQAKEIEQLRAELEKATGQLTSIRSSHKQDMFLIEQGFEHEDVRHFFRKSYHDQMAEKQPDQRVDFSEWIEATKESPLYSVHHERALSRRTGVQVSEAQTPEQQAPQVAAPSADANLIQAIRAAMTSNPNAGAGQPADTRAKDWTVEEVRKLRARNGGTLGAHKDEIMAQWRAKGVIK